MFYYYVLKTTQYKTYSIFRSLYSKFMKPVSKENFWADEHTNTAHTHTCTQLAINLIYYHIDVYGPHKYEILSLSVAFFFSFYIYAYITSIRC